MEPDDAPERVADDHGAGRVDQAGHCVGHRHEGVLGQRRGAAVAREVRRHPRAGELCGEPVPDVGGGTEPVEEQDDRSAWPPRRIRSSLTIARMPDAGRGTTLPYGHRPTSRGSWTCCGGAGTR